MELQGFEPWSEHGLCRAFYMFIRSCFSRLSSRPTYQIQPLFSPILSNGKKTAIRRLYVSTPLIPPRQRLAGERCGEWLIYTRLSSHGILSIASCCLEEFLNGGSTNSIHAYTRKNITPSKPVSPKYICTLITLLLYLSSAKLHINKQLQ